MPNSLLQPATLPIEDFPVRNNIPGPGLTCQNNLECTLFDDCVEVPPPSNNPSVWLRMTARAELGITWWKTTYRSDKVARTKGVPGDRWASFPSYKT